MAEGLHIYIGILDRVLRWRQATVTLGLKYWTTEKTKVARDRRESKLLVLGWVIFQQLFAVPAIPVYDG